MKVDSFDDSFWNKAEAVVYSMTPEERKHPEIINGSRRKRIAARQRHDAAGSEPVAEPVEGGEEDHAAVRHQPLRCSCNMFGGR